MCSTPLYFVEKRKKNKLKEYPHEVRFEGCTYENFPLILGLILETSNGKNFLFWVFKWYRLKNRPEIQNQKNSKSTVKGPNDMQGSFPELYHGFTLTVI